MHAPATGAAPGATTHRADPRRHGPLVLVALATVLATVLGLRHIEARSFWLDEATTFFVSGVEWPRLLEVFGGDARGWHPPTYFTLLKAWRSVFGESEVALRAMSTLFAALSVPVTYLVARRLLGPWTAALAALLLATNAFAIEYAQEARTYTLTMFLAVLATWLFLRARERADRGPWLLYAGASVLGVYSQLFFGGLVAAHLVSLAAPALRPREAWGPALGFGLIGLLSAPLVIGSLIGSNDILNWVGEMEWEAFYRLGLNVAGGTDLALLAYGIGSLVALAWMAGPGRDWRWTPLLLAWVLLPTVLLAVVSLVKPTFVLRYLIVSLPGWTILVAMGVSRLPRPAALVAAAAVVAISLGAVRAWYHEPSTPWRDVAAHLADEGSSRDGVVLSRSVHRKPLAYQLIRRGPDVPRLVAPPVPWSWNQYDGEPRPNTGAVEAAMRCELANLWLIGGPSRLDRWDQPFLAGLGAGYEHRGSSAFGPLRVHRYARVGDACPTS